MMRFSLCAETVFPDLPFTDRLVKLSELGVKTVEFWAADKPWSRLKEVLSEQRMQIAIFSGQREGTTYLAADHEGYRKEVLTSMKLANEVGVNTLMVLMDPLEADGSVKEPHGEIPWSDKAQNSIDLLKQLAKDAEAAGIVLAIEPLNTPIDHPGYSLDSSDKAMELVSGVNSPNLKMLYDAYHMHVMGEDVTAKIKEYLPFIGHIHVANHPGRHGLEKNGELDLQGLVHFLKETGYEGAVGFEYFPASADHVDSISRFRDFSATFQGDEQKTVP